MGPMFSGKAREIAMANAEKTPPSIAAASGSPGASEACEGTRDAGAATVLDELYNDPETLKRIGTVIATAALRSSSAKY